MNKGEYYHFTDHQQGFEEAGTRCRSGAERSSGELGGQGAEAAGTSGAGCGGNEGSAE